MFMHMHASSTIWAREMHLAQLAAFCVAFARRLLHSTSRPPRTTIRYAIDEYLMAICSPLIYTLLRCFLVGGLLGTMSSLMVNCSLVEVSVSPFFAIAFGLLFLTSGFMMVAQIYSLPNAKNRVLLMAFAVLNFVSGIITFFLERDWSHGLSASHKVPLYMLLGSCLAFSVNFSSLDLIARFECFSSSQILVRAEWQLRVVAFTSIFTGGLYGYTFGALNLEEALVKSPASFRAALHREATIVYPLAFGSGAVAAVVARLLEQRAEANDPDLGYSRGHQGRGHDSL